MRQLKRERNSEMTQAAKERREMKKKITKNETVKTGKNSKLTRAV